MSPRLVRIGYAVLLVMFCSRSPASASAEFSAQQIYERDAPAVVLVTAYGGGGEKGTGGTGSIIRRDGLILTNAHVVVDEKSGKPFSRLTVYLKPDRVTGNPRTDFSRSVRASLVKYSQPLDLALLKMDSLPESLPVVEVADSDRVRIGDRVLAIGHPEQGGLWTLTTGVISTEFEDFNGTKGKNVFQTETGLNRGNSGGPLLDGDGRMVGVNTAIARVASDGMPITSISFSLKSNVARKWLREQGVVLELPGGGPGVPPARPKTTAVPAETAPPPLSVTTAPPRASGPVPMPVPQQSELQPEKNPPVSPKSPTFKGPAVTQVHPESRPYNLDNLVDELSRAEAEMEDMIKESRQEIERRSRRGK